MRQFFDPLLKLLFPPLCLHCKEDTGALRRYFCTECASLFSLISQIGRCRSCFFPLEECTGHRDGKFPFRRVAAALEYQGPAATLVRQFKYHNRSYLAKDCAALLVLQLLQMDWPLPDLIVPVPQAFTRLLTRGYNQSLLLAQEAGQLLDRPIVQALKRLSGDLPQASLDKREREILQSDAFYWKKGVDISEKTVLLIDDVRTTGTTLSKAGALLREGHPAALYGITVCM